MTFTGTFGFHGEKKKHWWMVDGGGWWVEKKFFDFSQNLHIDSTPKDNFLIFGVKRENFLMGLKIDFRG